MIIRYVSSLALIALLLPACSSGAQANSASDNSAQSASDAASAAPSPADSSDPLAQFVPTFQKMEGAIDNDFADVMTTTKNGPETVTSIGFYPQYPCTVGTNADKSAYWGYCIMGVTSSKENADADFDAAKQIIAKGDSTLTPGTAPAGGGKNIAEAAFGNDTHGIYLFETQQANGKYLVKMTFAKPAALK